MLKTTLHLVPLLTLVSFSSGCSEPGDDPYVKLAKSEIESKLFDPGSAQYKNGILGTSDKGERLVCLDVNAKNKMGGYNGFSTNLCSFGSTQNSKATCLNRAVFQAVAESQIKKINQLYSSISSTPILQAAAADLKADALKGVEVAIGEAEANIIKLCGDLKGKKGTIVF